MKFSVLSALFLSLLAAACGPNSHSPYQQPYYDQQPVIVNQPGYPVVVPVPALPTPVYVPQQRVTTERRTTVAPVQIQQAQPQQLRAKMLQGQQQQVAPATQNLSDRAGQARGFQVQQGVQQKAVGFGAKPAVAPAPAFRPSVAPAARPATQFRAPANKPNNTR